VTRIRLNVAQDTAAARARRAAVDAVLDRDGLRAGLTREAHLRILEAFMRHRVANGQSEGMAVDAAAGLAQLKAQPSLAHYPRWMHTGANDPAVTACNCGTPRALHSKAYHQFSK
jgi:hypothetical protein